MTDRLPYPPPWQDTATLAAHLSVSPDTVKNWAEQGIIPAPRKRGGKLMWRWREVDAKLAAGNAGLDDLATRVRNGTRAAAAEIRSDF
jgi:predicted site-specific integrase-resolvase